MKDNSSKMLSKSVSLITMVGALPPLKGNAYYCMGLATEASKVINVDFLTFNRLYPGFLYPGGTVDEDQNFYIEETRTLSIRRFISCYNPVSWIRAGLMAKGKVVHLQWWSIPPRTYIFSYVDYLSL